MNSTATTILTDFISPWNLLKDDRQRLLIARCLTFGLGVLGTGLGVLFLNPDIKSLFDAFIKVIGIFMGVLGGLFLLGTATTRGNAVGALWGALVGAASMAVLWTSFPTVSSVVYPAVGVGICWAVGYIVSLLTGGNRKDLDGLTVFTLR